MKRVRSIVFWLHLAAGVVAGIVILVMAVTGALLALKPQILNAIESDVRTVTPPPGAARLGVEALLTSAFAMNVPDARPATVTLAVRTRAHRRRFRSDATERSTSIRTRAACSATVRSGRSSSFAASKTGTAGSRSRASIAPPRVPSPARPTSRSSFSRSVDPTCGCRGSGRGPTCARCCGFAPPATAALAISTGITSSAPWCAPVLFVLTLTGVVMSYPWANATLYRLAGSPMPVQGGGPGGPGAGPGGPAGGGRTAGAAGGEAHSAAAPAAVLGKSRRLLGASRDAGSDMAIDHRAPARTSGCADDVHDRRRSVVESVRALAADGQHQDRRGNQVGAVRRSESRTEMARLGPLRSHRRTGRSAGPADCRHRLPRRNGARLDGPRPRVPAAACVAPHDETRTSVARK